MMPRKNFLVELRMFLLLVVSRKHMESEPLPEALLPLTQLYSPDEVTLTSAETQPQPRQFKVLQSVS